MHAVAPRGMFSAACLLLSISAQGTIRYVDADNAVPSFPYTSWTTAANRIQDGVDAAESGDSVIVAAGTYMHSSAVTVTNAIILLSQDGPEFTIIDGGGSDRCIDLRSAETMVSGFTLRNGWIADGFGGGISCAGVGPVASNCLFISNFSGSGGGGMANGTAIQCEFLDNRAGDWGGGGLRGGEAYGCLFAANACLYADGGAMNLGSAFGCTFASNSAHNGGALYDSQASNCLIQANTAEQNGGGMAFGTAWDCTVSSNSAGGQGGGLYEVSATNCHIGWNHAYWYGGGMYEGEAYRCRICGNDADEGGGTYSTMVYNSLLEGNRADQGGGARGGTLYSCTVVCNGGVMGYSVQGVICYNTIVFIDADEHWSQGLFFNSCCPDIDHGINGNITNDPLFVAASDGNYRLRFDSPCIDSGMTSATDWDADLDGRPRIVGTEVDMGAFEYNPVFSDSDGDGIPDGWEMTYFGGPTGCVASGQSDSDGMDNLQEYIAGTDPLDRESFFRITEFTNTSCCRVLRWDAVSNRLYTLQRGSSLTNMSDWARIEIPCATSCYTDCVNAAASDLFYRLEVRLGD